MDNYLKQIQKVCAVSVFFGERARSPYIEIVHISYLPFGNGSNGGGTEMVPDACPLDNINGLAYDIGPHVANRTDNLATLPHKRRVYPSIRVLEKLNIPASLSW